MDKLIVGSIIIVIIALRNQMTKFIIDLIDHSASTIPLTSTSTYRKAKIKRIAKKVIR